MEPVLYLDLLRYIRTYLPLKDAHRFREVNRDLRNFTSIELGRLYNTQNVIESAKIGDLTGVKYLLARHINDGYEALMWAAYNGHYEIVRYLVEYNVKIDDETLTLAARNGHGEDTKCPAAKPLLRLRACALRLTK